MAKGSEKAPLISSSLQKLVELFAARLRDSMATSAAARRQLRDRLHMEAGGLNYDQLEGAFRRIATELAWPRSTTLKGFRHLFATMLENSGVPDSYRRFFMGHSPGRGMLSHYTHLNQVEEQFQRYLERDGAGLVTALQKRLDHFTMASPIVPALRGTPSRAPTNTS